ncbi:peptidase [Cedecea davisae]|uniref:Peptidase n=1 Tax=Cedecea davisae TaxID=158484 RepID=A0ABS6DCI8_9ENTR|nr:DNZ54_00345 family protein [Cedecea davisae]MBU4680490.1 peptidase [Cedecea davisae]MBU4684982.1 peptidase [Cedecea davisae]
MKKKFMSMFFQIVWAALLVLSLLYPRSGAPVLVGASVQVACILAWLMAAFAAIGWAAGEVPRNQVRASLMKFRMQPVKPVRTWAVRLLIVACLAISGWAITLVFYLLTLVLYQIARAQFHKPVTA